MITRNNNNPTKLLFLWCLLLLLHLHRHGTSAWTPTTTTTIPRTATSIRSFSFSNPDRNYHHVHRTYSKKHPHPLYVIKLPGMTSSTTNSTSWNNNQDEHQDNTRDKTITSKDKESKENNDTSRLSTNIPKMTYTTPDIKGNENDDSLQPSLLESIESSGSNDISGGVAILVNTNARGVTPMVLEALKQVVQEYNTRMDNNSHNNHSTLPKPRLYITNTMDQVHSAIQELAATTPSLLIPIGGDGTLTTLIQLWSQIRMEQYAKQQQQHQQHFNGSDNDNDNDNKTDNVILLSQVLKELPRIAYIPMGTGNALEPVIGCTTTSTNLVSFNHEHKVNEKRSLWKRFVRRFKRQGKMEGLKLVLTELLDLSYASILNPCNVDVVELPLIQVTTTQQAKPTANATVKSSSLCFFAGVGFDSLMLQHYQDLQEWMTTTTTTTMTTTTTSNRNSPPAHDNETEESLATTATATGTSMSKTIPKEPRKQHQQKRRFILPFLKPMVKSVFGYCIALVTKTLPECLSRNKHVILVQVSTTLPNTTLWIDHRRGDVARSITATTTTASTTSAGTKNVQQQQQPRNDNQNNDLVVLYQGKAGIVAASTVPFYGGRLRLFPFSRMLGPNSGMQLRIGRIHPLRGVVNIPNIFKGSYRDLRHDAFGCLDFLLNQCTIQLLPQQLQSEEQQQQQHEQEQEQSHGYPVQHSGESIGICQTVDLKVLQDAPIRFVTLLPPRLIYEELEET